MANAAFFTCNLAYYKRFAPRLRDAARRLQQAYLHLFAAAVDGRSLKEFVKNVEQLRSKPFVRAEL
jgi:23S rRNA A2030 N6-methylase RlmJ